MKVLRAKKVRGEKDGPRYDNTGLVAHNMQNSGHRRRERVVLFGIEAGGFMARDRN